MQFAGGHASRFIKTNQPILWKELKKDSTEDVGYEEMSASPLARFIPKYHGTIVAESKKYVQIENLLFDFEQEETNTIDIKISYIKNPPLCYRYPMNFRIVGTVINRKNIRVNKLDDFFSTIHYMEDHIKGFEHHLPFILTELDLMCQTIKNSNKLFSSSLFIAVSKGKCVVKIIDFTDYHNETYQKRKDVDFNYYNIEHGLGNIYRYYNYLYNKSKS